MLLGEVGDGGGKRHLLRATSVSQTFIAQQSFAHPRELVPQQKDLPRQKTEDSGIKQREHAARAEHWYELRPAGAPGGFIEEIENTRWDKEAVVPVQSLLQLLYKAGAGAEPKRKDRNY